VARQSARSSALTLDGALPDDADLRTPEVNAAVSKIAAHRENTQRFPIDRVSTPLSQTCPSARSECGNPADPGRATPSPPWPGPQNPPAVRRLRGGTGLLSATRVRDALPNRHIERRFLRAARRGESRRGSAGENRATPAAARIQSGLISYFCPAADQCRSWHRDASRQDQRAGGVR